MDENIRVYQDKAKAIKIIKDVSRWLRDSGKEVSEWWDPDKINEHFFDKYAKDTDFYVLDIDGIPAATVILQEQQNLQDWSEVELLRLNIQNTNKIGMLRYSFTGVS